MDTEDLVRCGCRPIRIPLRNAVDGFVDGIDESGSGWTGRIYTENLCPSILDAWTSCSAHPVVPANDNGHVTYRITSGRTRKIGAHTCDLVVSGDLVSIQVVNDVRVNRGPFPPGAEG